MKNKDNLRVKAYCKKQYELISVEEVKEYCASIKCPYLCTVINGRIFAHFEGDEYEDETSG